MTCYSTRRAMTGTGRFLFSRRTASTLVGGFLRLGLVALLWGVLPRGAAAQLKAGTNELAVQVGGWTGEDFLRRTAVFTDSVLGQLEFGTEVFQDNGWILGLRYTHMFLPWLGAEATGAYLAVDATTVVGRVVDDSVTGTTDRIRNLVTGAFAGGVVAFLPLAPGLPAPFLSAGVGAVTYRAAELRGPLTFDPVVGETVDTTLFVLDLGVNGGPTFGGGIAYYPTDELGFRLEARWWFISLHERVADERLRRRNAWITASVNVRL
ncbi:MAG: hypothetical protein KatS3mg081_1891 [Gemmatimonadales bacterium]|nr:hypothetical protein HRbin33_01334 [bacterium HR33]GIW52536.1 MAG: hypothetical protein KatS3mg081_1891 [Gemmatimonadales bacterium]